MTILGSYCTEEEQRDDDSDNICGNDDSCIFDNANDADSDMICGDVDSCPHDTENDADSDALCVSEDVCPHVSVQNVDPNLFDCRGICRTSVDCRGDCDGSAVVDSCGVCAGDGTSCIACKDSAACNFDRNALYHSIDDCRYHR